jgi:hypothetical protein
MVKFEWSTNPSKEISPSTQKSYQARLNALARLGYTNKDALLTHSDAVRKFIDDNPSQQMRNLYYASVFYILGRIDPEKEPRGATLIQGFQKNYYRK